MLKQIKSQEEIDRKKRRTQIIVGAILIGLMIVSTAGYAFLNQNRDTVSGSSTANEKGFQFVRTGELWKLSVNSKDFYFRYLPSEVSNVSIVGNYNFSQYAGQPVYFINSNGAGQEIATNIGSFFLRFQEACISGMNCTQDLPEKDCSNNLFIFVDGNETKVWQNQSCVYMTGEAAKGEDAFLYKILGIN